MRTLSAIRTAPNQPDDIDFRIVDGLASLRQRTVQAIRFRFGTWFLDNRRGLQYDMIMGHGTTLELAASTLTETIRIEGADEITNITDVTVSLNAETREMRYRAVVQTIYGGEMTMTGVL